MIKLLDLLFESFWQKYDFEKHGKGKPYIPKYFVLPKATRDKFKEHIKIFGDKIYISTELANILNGLQRGRTTYSTNTSNLKLNLLNSFPQQIRLVFKKGMEGQRMVNVGGKSMIPLNLSFHTDEQNFYFPNPYLDKATINEQKQIVQVNQLKPGDVLSNNKQVDNVEEINGNVLISIDGKRIPFKPTAKLVVINRG